MKNKLLAILPRIPYPLEKGDKLRAYHQLRCLAKDYEIYLFALNDDRRMDEEKAKSELLKFCKEVRFFYRPMSMIIWNTLKAFFEGIPLQVGYFYSSKAMKEVKRWHKQEKFEFVFCQLLRVAPYGKQVDAIKTLDYQDVFSKGVERRISEAPLLLRPCFKLEYARLLSYEKAVFEWFDVKTIISIPDRDLIPHPKREEIAIIPNGVDYNFFYPMDKKKDIDLVFTGNMGYPPNVRAARMLALKILPLVHKTHPNATLLISGASPDPKVKALESEKVTVSGWVEDMRDSYARSTIFIAPMEIGTGLQNKLLEAMAMKIPCITSELANSALKAKPGEEVFVGNTPQEFADLICSLLDDEALRNTLAEKGNAFVHAHFSWEQATQKMSNLMQEVKK